MTSLTHRSNFYKNPIQLQDAREILTTLSDKRRSVCNEELGISFFEAEVLTQTDYYPFGAVMPDRQWSAGAEGYRYGFNGMERDDETYGKGNALDFGARIYDSRLGRWLSVDALCRKYVSHSPYNFSINSPIQIIDIDGNDVIQTNKFLRNKGTSAGLTLFTSTATGSSFLLQFAKVNQIPRKGYDNVDLQVQKDGILSNHNVTFNTNTKDPGLTTLKIKNSDGKFVTYKGQEVNENTVFEISIGISATALDPEAGTAYVIGHEAFAHAEGMAEVLLKFENTKKEANGDPVKINLALTTLKDDLKQYDAKNNLKLAYEKTKAEHKTILDGTNGKLNVFVGELKELLSGNKKQLDALDEAIETDIDNQASDQ